MDVKQLKARIISKTVPNFLVFTGEEWEIQKIYINQIAKVYNLNVSRIDSVQDILSKLKASSFVNNTSYMYVVRDDKLLTTDEKVLARVKDNLGKNILVLLLTKLDKRLKFYTGNKDSIVIFEALTPEILAQYVRKQIQLNDKNCDKLIEVCEGNYGRILLEIDKIKQYRAGGDFDDSPKIFDYCFTQLVQDGTIYQPPKDAIFDFVDAVLDRRVNKAYALYEQCKAINESSLAILTNLFNNTKAILQVQTCTGKDVAKTTGLTGWQIMNAKKHLDVYTNNELITMLELIQYCEQGIKTGIIEEEFVIDYILVRMM